LDAKAKVDLAPAETKKPSEAVTSGFIPVSVDSIVLAATLALGSPSASAGVVTDDTAVPVAPANGSGPILGSGPTTHGTLESSRVVAVDPNANAPASAIEKTAAANAPASAIEKTAAANAPASAIEKTAAASAPASATEKTAAAIANADTAPVALPPSLTAPIVALFATDSRTVASSERKTGTSGDTQLGRVLTRAINVASTNVPAAPPTSNGSNTSTGGDLSSFLNAFAAAVAKADGSQNASVPSGIPANDFLATLDAANAVSIATSLPGAPVPTVGIASTNGPAPIAFDASLFATPPSYAPQSADRYAVVEQVLKGISVRNLGGVSNSEVRLRLVPEHLGDVNVKLVVTNGGVNATVVAANSDVRDTLIANQQQLARSLESAGLKLTGFSVDVSNGGFAGFQHQQQQQSSATRGAVASEFDDSDVQADLAIAATPSFAPPQAADVRLGHLNALV